MSLVPYNDAVLHQPCLPFDFETGNAEELSATLLKEMDSKNGLGLAAPQIGIPLRAFAFLDIVAFNPEILEKENEEILSSEGCLSYPGLWIAVKRPKQIKVKYQDEKGFTHVRWLDNLESRVFQHELDHLDGVTFVDRASTLKLRRAVDQANKHGQNYTFGELRAKV